MNEPLKCQQRRVRVWYCVTVVMRQLEFFYEADVSVIASIILILTCQELLMLTKSPLLMYFILLPVQFHGARETASCGTFYYGSRISGQIIVRIFWKVLSKSRICQLFCTVTTNLVFWQQKMQFFMEGQNISALRSHLTELVKVTCILNTVRQTIGYFHQATMRKSVHDKCYMSRSKKQV